MDAGVGAEPAMRRNAVQGVTGQEHPPDAVAIGDPGGDAPGIGLKQLDVVQRQPDAGSSQPAAGLVVEPLLDRIRSRVVADADGYLAGIEVPRHVGVDVGPADVCEGERPATQRPA